MSTSSSSGGGDGAGPPGTNNYTIQEVVCPICAALPSGSGGDPNHLTEDLLQHINVEHLNNPSRNVDDGGSEANALINSNFGAGGGSGLNSTASAVAAAAALRFSRRLNYSQNTLRAAAHGGSSSGSSSSVRNLIGRYFVLLLYV